MSGLVWARSVTATTERDLNWSMPAVSNCTAGRMERAEQLRVRLDAQEFRGLAERIEEGGDLGAAFGPNSISARSAVGTILASCCLI